jgi:serine phosphatase RsbU (regulator of sigma subunit)
VIDPLGLPEPPVPASSSWKFNGVQLSARIQAAASATRGGDWCEAFVVGDGIIALSIGDVCGHGEAKYATMSAIREVIRDAARRGLDPSGSLAAAHVFLRDHDPDGYATAIFAYLDIARRKLTIANAGHPPPLMCHQAGGAYLNDGGCDLPLGIEDAFVPALRYIDVPDDALLVFYTDGVTEHDRKPLHGEAQLRQAAIFAYNFSSLPTAAVIQKHMGLADSNHDDLAILTAWTPRSFPRSVSSLDG